MHTQRGTIPRIGLLLFILLLAWPSLRAQTGTAVIVGTISDSTGAAMAGVKVVATNVDTGFTVSATTGASGDYRLPGLSPGNYEIRADKEGFASELRRGISLTVSQQLEANLTMQVGAFKQEVVVNDKPPIVESVSSSLSDVVDENRMKDLPLNGRDLWQLVLLEPGVSPNPSAGPSPWQKGGFGKAAVNGQRPTSNNLLIDGMDANDPNYNITPGGAAGVMLGVDAIREFRVITDTYTAEYGRNAGSIIQMVTKSGTNVLHGSGFEFLRNAALDAKNYFDPLNAGIPPFVRNQFGGSLGGPIKKDKAFFFASYEGFREGQANTSVSTVPNLLAHHGILPASSGSCATGGGAGCVNVGVNPQIAPYLAVVALPNGADNGDGTGQITSTEKRITNEDYAVGRFDYMFSSTHSIFSRYIYDGSSSIVPYLSTLVPGFPGRDNVRGQYATLQDQKFITPNLLNLFAFGFDRLGMLAAPIDTHPGLAISLLPNRPLGVFSVAGLGAIGNNLVYPLGSYSNTFQVQDNLSWTNGQHSLKFGGEFRRMQINGPFDLFVNGEYAFQDLTPFGVPWKYASNNHGLENFLEGVPLIYVGIDPARSDSDRGFRQNGISWYVQDDWRVKRSLTINFGLRYEFYSNPSESEGKEVNIRNLATDASTTVGKFMNSTPKDLFAPRLGFAWKIGPDGKTVLRGGVGAFNDQIWANVYGNARSLPPFYQAVEAILPQFLNPLNALGGVGTTANASLDYYPKWPIVYQYNLNLQRQLTSNSVVSFAYVGSRGNHLGRMAEGNPAHNGVRPNPNFGSIVRYLTDAQSFYNGFQAVWEQRTSKGLNFQANYNFSHSIDDSSGYNPSDAVNDSGKSQDINNRIGSRGRSGFDMRHNLVFNTTYELPFGPGKAFGRTVSGAAAKLIGGWRVSAIGTFHSNVPFTPVLGFDNAGTGSIVNSDRPNLVGNPFSGTCANGAPVKTVNCWYNAAAYATPPAGQFGNAGRNSLPGPDYKEFDLSLSKITAIGERASAEFRAEFFNLPNHPNFAVPANTTGPNGSGGNGDAVPFPNAGQIFSTVSSSRQIQFGLKFTF
jgi:hypothetical protein